jgi:hypothetical protein
VQGTELLDHQEPEDDDGTAGTEEVLQPLPQAQAAQRGEIVIGSQSSVKTSALATEN